MHKFINIYLLLLCVISIQTHAQIIDFELVPGVGVPAEGLIISEQYKESVGITFSLEGGGNPRIAQVGQPATAFGGSNGDDTPALNQGVGNFFLTDDGFLSGLIAPPLIVSYVTPTAAASGVILDIDFDESFIIQARDDSGNTLETIHIHAGDPGSGDGMAIFWSISRSFEDIASIRFAGTRTASGAFGLGFDNFSARSVVEKPQISVKNGFIKLDTTEGSNPNDQDCLTSNHYGRMVFDEANGILFICGETGWLAFNGN